MNPTRSISCTPTAPTDLCKAGYLQSPINICSESVEEMELSPLCYTAFHWNPNLQFCMTQTGDTVLLRPAQGAFLGLKGGPLVGTYALHHFHFHWGEKDDKGSEHSIDSAKYGMEAHLTYYNCFYGCFEQALGQVGGIAVLSVLMKSSQTEQNKIFEEITSKLCLLDYPPGIVYVDNILPIFRDIFDSQKYYIYDGSLSTPPCSEDVVSIVFKKLLTVNCNQIASFRQVCNAHGCKINKNYRSLQSLNGRTVYSAKPCAKQGKDNKAKKKRVGEKDEK